MHKLDKILKAYNRDNPATDAGGWIQWKGTDVCIDITCECGANGHIDGDFAYQVDCPYCGRKYLLGSNIKLIELTKAEAKEDFHDPYQFDTPPKKAKKV